MASNDAIERAARELFEWNTEAPSSPRFVLHDVGGGTDDPYVALVSKVAGLLNDGTAQARLSEFAEQVASYFTAVYGKDYVYQPPEAFALIEQWMYAVATGSPVFGGMVMDRIIAAATEES